MFNLDMPWMLALLPLPWLVYRFAKPVNNTPQSGIYVPFADDLRMAAQAQDSTKPASKFWLMVAAVAWLLLLLAAARPQWLGDAVEVSRSGRDVMLAVDLSGSMHIQDFTQHGRPVDRLTVTKQVAGDFIKRRVGDRIGLILFGSQAYLQAPMTFDRTTVNQLLQESVIGLAGKKTAIGDAIGLAVKRLKDQKDVAKLVLILLTDGVNTAGQLTPEEGVALAKEIGLKIHTIGIGASSIEVQSFFGTRTVNPSADLDEAMLKSIAKATGGQYFRAHDVDELKQVYAVIDQLEPVKGKAQSYRPIQSLFIYPLALAMLLAGLCVVRRQRWT
ncbi:MAG: VWA domain-containing protein [Mariprofundaceae bacterium]|nr:VWA domain-containing protein [Mariprofundaceae bacterium]